MERIVDLEKRLKIKSYECYCSDLDRYYKVKLDMSVWNYIVNNVKEYTPSSNHYNKDIKELITLNRHALVRVVAAPEGFDVALLIFTNKYYDEQIDFDIILHKGASLKDVEILLKTVGKKSWI